MTQRFDAFIQSHKAFAPNAGLTQAVFEYLSGYGTEAHAAYLASAIGFYNELYRTGASDWTINAETEHAHSMKKINRQVELSAELLALDPESEDLIRSYRRYAIAKSTRDRNFEQRRKQETSAPKAARYGLCVAIAAAWPEPEIPRRQKNKLNEPSGKFHAFICEILSLVPGAAAHISADELHKSILLIERNEAQTQAQTCSGGFLPPTLPNSPTSQQQQNTVTYSRRFETD